MKAITFSILFFSIIFSSFAENNFTVSSKKDVEVKVYYFHATRRCATCQAVESVTKEALKGYTSNSVAFLSVNREEDANNALVEKYQISGQALIVVHGDQVKDLTNLAFLNARRKPSKLKTKIKETIDAML